MMNRSETKATIVVLDDHEIYADGIKRILESNLNVNVSSHFVNGKEALNYFNEGGIADLVLLDLYMPQMNGLEFLEYIQEENPGIKILVASLHGSDTDIFLTRRLGAHGFIRKDSSLKDMLQAVEEVLDGDFYFPDNGKNIGSMEQIEHAKKSLGKRFDLSRPEVKVLDLLLERRKIKEIANELHLSPMTVKSHRKHIYQKFGVESLAGVVFLLKEEVDRG
jgi:DNA-binding NarL/FixJ family response regulator